MLNFSVLGRGATFAQRSIYVDYDKDQGERSYLSSLIKNKFPDLEVQIAGETGIDIFPNGKDKSQVLDYFLPSEELATIHFFGDKMEQGGNDKPLVDAIINRWQGDYKIHKVSNWTETFNVLKTTVI
jgi:phosphomannomutase